MDFLHITTDRQLNDYCEQLAGSDLIAFDTEFVSEDTYLPDLCLIQVNAGGRLAVIDPRSIRDVSPFWSLLVSQQPKIIVHAGREELRFCLRAVAEAPRQWFDTQVAAGFIGLEYPASYGNLVTKILRQTLPKGETRTDWRHRPLSSRQLEYALQDVVHLVALRDELQCQLRQLDREGWLQTEMESWQREIRQAEGAERWRRVSGISSLSERSLAIVRRLWQWREKEAEQRDVPPRRVLRDDLLVELARRQTSDIRRIQAVRGLRRGPAGRKLPEIARCIESALQTQREHWPKTARRKTPSQVNVMAQFLSTAVANICHRKQIAPSLVGSVQDVRDLVAFHLGIAEDNQDRPPALARGWRSEVVGKQIDQLLDGKLSIRITDPKSEHPLSFEPVE